MGWFSGSPPSPSGGSDSPATPSSKDPIASLEPSLREYLQAQVPHDHQHLARQRRRRAYATAGAPLVLRQPHAHLWTTYQPPQAGASEQEALTGILRAHRARQAHAARAALENCSEAQLALRACHRAGGLRGCATHARRLDDCYSTQLRLLCVLTHAHIPISTRITRWQKNILSNLWATPTTRKTFKWPYNMLASCQVYLSLDLKTYIA
ncbi:hypothetical protein EV426DRAFT_10349 [Tirmania nivea]|nr:hypothetical protein EV426DRAFT_10349 [Tirmania nivea]